MPAPSPARYTSLRAGGAAEFIHLGQPLAARGIEGEFKPRKIGQLGLGLQAIAERDGIARDFPALAAAPHHDAG